MIKQIQTVTTEITPFYLEYQPGRKMFVSNVLSRLNLEVYDDVLQ